MSAHRTLPPLLFYSGWPLGYVNREAERKARSFAAAGYDVVYVTGAGLRNPRLSRAPKLVAHAGRALRETGAVATPPANDLASRSLLVSPPRQLAAVRRANVRWVERQLASGVPGWPEAVAWVRYPTPELVDALARTPPSVLVYEAVDAHQDGPGTTGRWQGIFDRSERRLVAQADLVIVSNAPLAPRFEAQGVVVHHVPHGVDLFPWRPREERANPVLGFLGVLDGRLDFDVLRHVAEVRPTWRVRLIGPVEAGFDPTRLEGFSNITIEPPVAHERIGEVLADFDVGLLAYADLPAYRGGFPLKLLELLAAGRTAVVRPNDTMLDLAHLVHFASTPRQFVEQVERALAEDSPAAAHARRREAEQRSWPATIDVLHRLLDGVRAEGPATG